MPDDGKKLDAFIKEIISDAGRESEKIRADYRASLDEAIEEAKLAFGDEAERYIQKGINEARTEAGRAVSRKMMDDKRTLFLYRKKLTDELNKDVKERIEAFTRTPEYVRRLEDILRTSLARFDHEPVTVYLRPDDMQTVRLAGQEFSRAGITIKEGSFMLGGLICECPGRRLMLDMTFDSRFAELSARYSELLDEVTAAK